MRARAVAPTTTQRRDQIVYLGVSLCKDYANFYVKIMYCCVKTTDFH
jgi:hypothetical protein